MRLILLFILAFCFSGTLLEAQLVAPQLLKEKIGEFNDGVVNQTIDQSQLNSIVENKVSLFFKNLSPQTISVQNTQIRFFLDRGWQLYSEVELDGQFVYYIKNLSLENDEFMMVEVGYEEACISSSCQDIDFINPQDGGCVCNSSGDVEYFFRTTQR